MDEDKDLEELRKRRALQIQHEAAQQSAVQEQQAHFDAQKQASLRKILTPTARERLGTLKMTRPDLVAAVEEQLIMLGQSGRLEGPIDDKTLKTLLLRMTPQKKEISITRR